MSRRRSGSQSSRGSYPQQELRQAVAGLLPHQGLPVLPTDLRRRWTARLLATCAVLLAWAPGATLADRFADARAQVVAMYPGRRRPGRAVRLRRGRHEAGLLSGRTGRHGFLLEAWNFPRPDILPDPAAA